MSNQHVSLTPKDKEDPVIENYLALFHAITDREILNPNKKVDSRKYLKGLFNEKEGQKRMKQIDLMRMAGMRTEAEQLIHHRDRFIKTKIINPSAGTVETFNSLKEACEEYDLNTVNVISNFNYKKKDKIKYKGLWIIKLRERK